MKALLSDWMIVFLFIVLFALCCLNSSFRTYSKYHECVKTGFVCSDYCYG